MGEGGNGARRIEPGGVVLVCQSLCRELKIFGFGFVMGLARWELELELGLGLGLGLERGGEIV